MQQLRLIVWAGLAGWLCLGNAGALRAETIIDILPNMQLVDLSVHGAVVEADRRDVSVEIPETRYTRKSILDLTGVGAGPRFAWTVYSLHNGGDQRREFVITIDAQRLSASGYLPLKPFGARVLAMTTSSAGGKLAPRAGSAQHNYSLALNPGEAITVAVEGRAPLVGARLYDEAAYSKRETSVAFLRGAALTVTLVITIFIIGLYSVRSHRAFVVGSLLALACLQFMALESGFLDRFASGIFSLSFGLQQIRAWSEGLLAFALTLSAWGLAAPSARQRPGFWWAALAILGFVGLSVLGWYRPGDAATAARSVIAISACSGFVLTLRAKQKQDGAMDLGLWLWSAIILWVFFAAVAALGPYEAPVFHAGILSGLATVVALLAFALARLALAQGYQSNPYLTAAASRSLALAGGRHVLWDWRAVEGRLHVGRELAEALGLDHGRLSGPDASRLFQAIVHPADQLSYQRCLAIQARNPGDAIETDLRLQGGDGVYRWFSLRATTVAGASNWPERAIGTLTDVTDSKESESRLITESVRDPVTGLPSRAIFNDRLERELAKPLALPVRVLIVGLSRFKNLNEGLGQDLGDQMLLVAGERIAATLGPDDTLARLSGSNFAVMHVEAIDKPGADDLATRIINRLAEPLPLGDQDIRLTACIGISQANAPGTTAAILLDQASTALQEAQGRGLSTAAAFDDSMRNGRAEAVAIESELRRALVKGEIETHFQPIVHLATRQIVGFEALARWNHPQRGYLPPGDFITVAEQSGLVGEVGASVLSESTRQLGVWQRTLARDAGLFVAVNISAYQLSDSDLSDRIIGIAEREGLRPGSLKVEITESVAMRFPERARQLIARLKASAISVACDDFGTGFSNLAALRDLQFDTLKMDRSFIADGGIEERGGIILSSVTSLAHQLGMQVVAEGIEDEQQAQHLEAMGVDMGQGFWLGAPMQARDVPGLLAVLPPVEELPALPLTQHHAPPPGTAPMAPKRPVEHEVPAVIEAASQEPWPDAGSESGAGVLAEAVPQVAEAVKPEPRRKTRRPRKAKSAKPKKVRTKQQTDQP